MREIKFRAWDKVRKIMIPDIQDLYDGLDFEFTKEDGNKGDIFDTSADDRSFGDNLHNENLEIMQFTGLKDKNGKEIFEGDIVNATHSLNSNYYKIVFAEDAAVFECVGIPIGGSCGLYGMIKYPHRIEVVGNIYENQELLDTK